MNTCTYCFGTHQATAEAMGIEPGLLDALLKDIDGAPVPEKMKPVLHYVRKLTL